MPKSLSKRLKEIEKAGVPYMIRAGNGLGEFSPENIVDYFETERLPEVISEKGYTLHKYDEDEQQKIYAKNLAKLAGKKLDYFLYKSSTNSPFSLNNIETHLIYNPKTDTTHIFLLPSRSI